MLKIKIKSHFLLHKTKGLDKISKGNQQNNRIIEI